WLAETRAAPAFRDPMTPAERADQLRSATALAPWDGRYATELGRSLLSAAFTDADSARRSEDLAGARAAFERAAWIAPSDGELRALLARTLAAQTAAHPGAASLARITAGFDRAMALEPENANVMELVSQGYLELGRTSDARAAALRCARLFPDFALPMADLGVAALLEGRPQAAADTLTLALRRNWHGQEAASMAAKNNYVAALRELRLGDVLKQPRN
ncbi:MAG TPA: hypothetical protein VEU09_11305, partial [Candidatus Binatia bacterium]|nr:hypothetical protein [Candidatus Binatia bacterium]